MQPEHLIARSHSFLQPAAGIEALNLLGPSVTAFDARDERLTDAELGGDVFLHPTGSDGVQNSFVAPVQFVHALPLAANDGEGIVSLLDLDRHEGANGQQEALYIGRGRDRIAEQPLVAALSPAAVFLDAPIAETLVHGVQGGAVSVREAKSNAALALVDFNAAFPVEKASEVAIEGVSAPVFHPYSLAQTRVAKKCKMAVPVMRWIGERIEAVDALNLQQIAA